MHILFPHEESLHGLVFPSCSNENWILYLQAGTRTIDVELTTISSSHHVELNPSDAGFQDRYVVQEIIKEMAKNRPIDTKGKKGFKGNSELVA